MFEQTSRAMKVALSILFVALLGVLVLVVLAQQGLLGKKAVAPQPAITTSQSKTGAATTSPAVVQKSTGDTNEVSNAPVPTISLEEAQKQFKAIQDQVNAGTLSLDEAKKQMNAMSTQMVPPPLPPGVKK